MLNVAYRAVWRQISAVWLDYMSPFPSTHTSRLSASHSAFRREAGHFLTLDKIRALYSAAASVVYQAAVVPSLPRLQLPKVLELIGLGYSTWFVYRYLLFKV